MSESLVGEPLRVVIADDHPSYRRGLARLLRESGIDVVKEVFDGEAAVRAVEETAPDVLVTDLHMPGMNGLEATRRLAARAPASRVLILSVSADEAAVTEALLAGATGYMLKDEPAEEVVAGIRAAAAGHPLISPRVATRLLERARTSTGAEGERPSERELGVLKLLAAGNANYEIARTLRISAGTVQNHITSLLMKLQFYNRERLL